MIRFDGVLRFRRAPLGMAVVAALVAALAGAFACASLDGLSGNPPPPDDAGSDSSQPDIDAATDGPTDAAREASIGPTAGAFALALRGTKNDGSASAFPVLIDPTNGSTRQLACPAVAGDLVDPQNSNLVEAVGPYAMRAFYDPVSPGKAKIVFPQLAPGNNVFNDNPLLLVDESSTCKLGVPQRDVAQGVSGVKMSVSFSDDGKRVAYLVAEGLAPLRLVTANTEGALDLFQVRSMTSPDSLATAPPAWVRDAEGLKVIWGEREQGNGLIVRIALDRAINPTPTLLMDCAGDFVDITQIGVFRGTAGNVFIAFTGQVTTGDAGTTSRSIYAVDYSKACSTRALVFPDSPGSISDDFVLSPDGDRMAHVTDRPGTISPDAAATQRRIWIGSVTDRTRKQCSDPPPGVVEQGPQWLVGGTRLAWTRRPQGTQFGGQVMIADVSGTTCTNVRPLLVLAANESALTAKNGCAIGRGRSTTASAVAFAAAAVAAIVRRRRRRQGQQ